MYLKELCHKIYQIKTVQGAATKLNETWKEWLKTLKEGINNKEEWMDKLKEDWNRLQIWFLKT